MEYGFSCKQCGACCDGNVSLSFIESLQYSSDFVLGLQIGLQPEVIYGINKEDQEINNKLYQFRRKFFPELKIDKKNYLIFLSVIEYDYASLHGRCPKLSQEGLCSIYERRPVSCQCTPVQVTAPQEVQGQIWEKSGKLFFEKGCLTKNASNTHPLIFMDQKVQQENIHQKLEKKWKSMAEEIPMYASIAGFLLQDPSGREAIQKLQESKSWSVLPLVMMLAAGVHTQSISPAEAIHCLENQISLMKDGIEKALEIKNKEERGLTNNFRSWIPLYENQINALRNF